MAEHYNIEGFEARATYDGATITWGSEQDEIEKKVLAEAFASRVDRVASAKILGTVVSVEGSNGNMTNYIMHTIRLTYTDGKKDVITIRESDPFVQAIVDKLEN